MLKFQFLKTKFQINFNTQLSKFQTFGNRSAGVRCLYPSTDGFHKGNALRLFDYWIFGIGICLSFGDCFWNFSNSLGCYELDDYLLDIFMEFAILANAVS